MGGGGGVRTSRDICTGFMFYLLKKEKNTVLSLPRALFMVRFLSQYLALSSALQFMHLTLVFLASSKVE